MTFKDYLRNGVNRLAEAAELFKKDVFELDGVPAFREFYTLYIFPWLAVYRGYYKPWHCVPIVSIKDPKGKTRNIATMNAGKMACAQMSRYVWNERCEIHVTREGQTTDNDPLDEFLQDVLKQNNFGIAFGDLSEKAFAIGGGALKEYVEIPKDEKGNDAGPGKIKISYHMATQFVPTAWNNAQVTSAIFLNREAKDGYYYTVVEWHKWEGSTYSVTNELYRQPIKGTDEPQNILGWWYPLDKVYPLLSPSTEMKDVHTTFFQYIKPFGANYVDDNSPIGMSVFSSALDTLHSIDIIFDSMQREFVLGKKRIIVPARAMRKIPDLNGNGVLHTYFDAGDEVYEALSMDDADANKIIDNSVALRVNDHITAINGELAILCGQIGFDPGTLSFDDQKGLKTATEVISENSKTFSTVKAHENGMRDALVNMVHAIVELAVQYDLEWKGQKISSLIGGGYNVAVSFDDSIIQDRAADIDEGIKLMGAAVMSKLKFMTDTLGYTPEEAEKEIKRIAAEKKITGDTVDTVLFSTSE